MNFLLFLGGEGAQDQNLCLFLFIISRGTMNKICVGEPNIYWGGGGVCFYTYVCIVQ